MPTLPRSSPSAQGVDARGILSFLDAVEAAPDVEMHSIMLLRHGSVVAEGWWAPYTADRQHLLYSLSKSFTSTALAFAVNEGLVSLDDTVLSHFPELDAEITDPRSRRMLVRHVAAMASGHLAEQIDIALGLDPVDIVRGFLLSPPDAEPGSVFAYNQPCTFSIAAIIQKAAGMRLTEYLRPRLFDPLGIGEVGWIDDGHGRELGFSGFHATTDAIAKLGQLYLQRGQWNGSQLIGADWVDEATRAQVSNFDDGKPDWSQGYGFQFWMARHGYRGDGAYGQFCVVLPEHDVVLAITGQSLDMQAVLDAAWEHLLPALAPDSSLPAEGTDDAERALADRLAAASLPPSAGSAFTDTPRTFAPGAGNGITTITGVTVAPTGLTITDSGAPLAFELGSGEWITSDFIAASGGVSPSGAIEVDVILVETPHRLRVVCGGETFAATWVTQPLHPRPLAEMRMPRA